MKRQTLATISFELRTSTNNIIGFAELMYEGRVGPISIKQKEHIGCILAASNEILELIRLISEFAEKESANSVIEKEFLAMLSNRLHTALNNIVGFANQVRPHSAVQQEYLHNIVSSSNNILQLFPAKK